MVKGFNKVFGGATGQDKLDATGGVTRVVMMGRDASLTMQLGNVAPPAKPANKGLTK